MSIVYIHIFLILICQYNYSDTKIELNSTLFLHHVQQPLELDIIET